jgi:hypothetical protein
LRQSRDCALNVLCPHRWIQEAKLMPTVYATDGLLILGVALVAATVFSAIRGLHARSEATSKSLSESGEYHAGRLLVPVKQSTSPAKRSRQVA